MKFYTLNGIVNKEPEIIKTKNFVIIYLENDKTIITTTDSKIMCFNEQGYATSINVSNLNTDMFVTKVTRIPKNKYNYVIDRVIVGERIVDIIEKTSSNFIEFLKVPQNTILDSGHIITGYTKNKIKYNKQNAIKEDNYEKILEFLI
ncbi:MAG: hypothetical protein QXW35_04575 [Candidatus Aenigmatarchaeota archaeon]